MVLSPKLLRKKAAPASRKSDQDESPAAGDHRLSFAEIKQFAAFSERADPKENGNHSTRQRKQKCRANAGRDVEIDVQLIQQIHVQDYIMWGMTGKSFACDSGAPAFQAVQEFWQRQH